MSQPFNRAATVPAARKPDESIGEFWVDNPWKIMAQGENLSAFERNRMYLNDGDGRFVEVSGVSGADSDGDGRAVAAADVDHDGRQDLVVRQAGGGSLILYMNRLQAPEGGGRWLSLALRGKPGRSNRLGIGARVTARFDDGGRPRSVMRELYPINTHSSQGEARIHLGLGAAETADVQVRWPSGQVTTHPGLKAGQRLFLDEAP